MVIDYHKLLGISETSPDDYKLLGIDRFEQDLDVISNAADRQMMYLRTLRNSEAQQLLLNEIAAARVTLLDREKRAKYDLTLLGPPKECRLDPPNFAALPAQPVKPPTPWTSNWRTTEVVLPPPKECQLDSGYQLDPPIFAEAVSDQPARVVLGIASLALGVVALLLFVWQIPVVGLLLGGLGIVLGVVGGLGSASTQSRSRIEYATVGAAVSFVAVAAILMFCVFAAAMAESQAVPTDSLGTRPSFGIRYKTDSEYADYSSDGEPRNGVMIWEVIAGSSADTAGLHPGDFLCHIDETSITSELSFLTWFENEAIVGKTYTIYFKRLTATEQGEWQHGDPMTLPMTIVPLEEAARKAKFTPGVTP